MVRLRINRYYEGVNMNITLEKWKAEDYEELFMLSNDKELWSNMSDDFPKTLKECKQLVYFSRQVRT